MSSDALTIARAEWRRARQAASEAGHLSEPGSPAWTIERAGTRLIAELTAHAERLQAEIDVGTGARVFFCVEAALELAKAELAAEDDGVVIRATDTHREWVMRPGGEWEELR